MRRPTLRRRLASLALPLLATGLLTQCDDDSDLPTEPGPPTGQGDVLVPEGFRIETLVSGLTYATDVAFAPDGAMFVSEAGGHTYGTSPEQAPPPRILRVMPDGSTRDLNVPVVSLAAIRDADRSSDMPEGLIAPITGITFNPDNGLLYVSHRTRVSTLDPRSGAFLTLIHDLPAWGEFQNNKVIFGPDRRMYFFVSTQGNSGPVGDHMLKVLTAYNKPNQHEIPCESVTLTGQNYKWPNPFTPAPNDTAVYDVYVPFGTDVPPGTTIPGQLKCNGAFYRANPDGTGLQRIAWGLRSNFGYRFTGDGRLITTMNSGNPIPPRQIFDDWETIWQVDEGRWYGWPDYYSGLPVTDPRFRTPNEPGVTKEQPLDFVLTEQTRSRLLAGGAPPQPLARIEPHYAIQGFVFGRREFGLPENEMIVAAFGTVVTYLRQELPGFEVIRVDLNGGGHKDFIKNRSGMPASASGGQGLERPIQVEWGPDGALYIVDFGVINITEQGLDAEPNTGKVWRLTRPG